jgi:hypothetical protein
MRAILEPDDADAARIIVAFATTTRCAPGGRFRGPAKRGIGRRRLITAPVGDLDGWQASEAPRSRRVVGVALWTRSSYE